MAGNSKKSRKAATSQTQPKRLAAQVSQAVQHPQARRIFGNFLKPDSFVTNASKMALTSLKKIVDGAGNFHDWNNLMVRMYAGSISYADYFKPDDGIGQSFNRAVASLQLIMVRTHCTGIDGFAMRPTEMDRIVDALSVFDTMTHYMRPEEVMSAYNNAGYYLDDIVKANKKASDLHDQRQAMAKQLATEYAEVADKPVEFLEQAA
jgi:hypothetical protein